MPDLTNCSIIKQKIFWGGFKSTDPPEYFMVFLKKNAKNLLSLLDDNKLIVIDIDGNEVDKIHWEEIIRNFYKGEIPQNNSKDNAKLIKKRKKKIKLKKKYEKKESKKNKDLQSLKNELLVQDKKNRAVLDRKIKGIEPELEKIKNKIRVLLSEIEALNEKINEGQ